MRTNGKISSVQMTDPTSRQRGRTTETRPQPSERNVRTGSSIWSQSQIGLGTMTLWLTDRPSAVTWLWYQSSPSHQCLGVQLGHTVPGGYTYGDLVLQVGGVSNETVKDDHQFCGTWTREWLVWQNPKAIVPVNYRRILSSERAPNIKKPPIVRHWK
jgi:hypothetical protein